MQVEAETWRQWWWWFAAQTVTAERVRCSAWLGDGSSIQIIEVDVEPQFDTELCETKHLRWR
jgi:hypothetical protein